MRIEKTLAEQAFEEKTREIRIVAVEEGRKNPSMIDFYWQESQNRRRLTEAYFNKKIQTIVDEGYRLESKKRILKYWEKKGKREYLIIHNKKAQKLLRSVS